MELLSGMNGGLNLALYDASLITRIQSVTVDGKMVFRDRLAQQVIEITQLSEKFGATLDKNAFAFEPNSGYFSTPLSADPEYAGLMKQGLWRKIKDTLEQELEIPIYAPFDQSDPHSKTPDGLNSMEISQLDHVKVLLKEFVIADLGRPSFGVGQEMELSTIVGIPVIAFSNTKPSRMPRGTPGTMVIRYEKDQLLIDLITEIFTRKSFDEQPFYTDLCHNHPSYGVFKGAECLNCFYEEELWHRL